MKIKVNAIWQTGDFLATTRINVAEMQVGAHRGDNPTSVMVQINRLLQKIPILELDEKSGEQFAVIKAAAIRNGRPVGDADLLIAAIAQINNCSILTRNPRHFQDVSGLKVESY